MRRIIVFAVAVALLASVAGAAAQVTARQGAASLSQEEHFASPMILDVPFPDITKIAPGNVIRLPELYRYVVDRHVLLRGLTASKQYKGRKNARSLELEISGQVFVAESYDRRVDIGLALISQDATIAKQVLRNLSAEEGRATLFAIVVPVDEQKLVSSFVGAKPPVLQLTVTVRDDS